MTNDESFLRTLLYLHSKLFSSGDERLGTGLDSFEDIETPNDEIMEDISQLLRAAIQLRPTLERLHRAKYSQPFTGEDIVKYAHSTQQTWSITWEENWSYVMSSYLKPMKSTQKMAGDLFSTYKQWLQDPELACRVAESYNEVIKDDNVASYPFCHFEYPGKLYVETSSCHCPSEAIWLDRPKFRGSYGNLNIEGFSPQVDGPQSRMTILHFVENEIFPHYHASR